MSARRRIRGSGNTGSGDVTIIGASDVDQTADLGDESNAITDISGTLSAQDLGDDLTNLDVGSFTVVLPLGVIDDSLQMNDATGTGDSDLGTDTTQTPFHVTGTFDPHDFGEHADSSFSADSTIYAQQHGSTANQSGTDWQNPNNALGKDTGNFAEIAAENDTLNGDSYSSNLELETYGLGPISGQEPTGFTRSAIDLKIYHSMKPNVNDLDLLSTLSHSLEIHDGTSTIRVLESWDDNSVDFETASEVTYALTDQEFQDMQRVQCNADCTLEIGGVTTSSVYWRVYYAAIEITYTRTGIA